MSALPPCPRWCVVDHAAADEELMRECSSAAVPLPTLTHATVSAAAIRLLHLDGQALPPEVRINNTTVTPAVARMLAAQLLNAADVAEGGVPSRA